MYFHILYQIPQVFGESEISSGPIPGGQQT